MTAVEGQTSSSSSSTTSRSSRASSGAEYGGALGGLVNVTTKSGSNDFDGLLNLEYRSSKLTGDPRPRLRVNPLDSTQAEYVQDPEDPFTQFDIGGVLGGPIVRDRLWFFAGYLPQIMNTDRDVTFLSTGRDQELRERREAPLPDGQADPAGQRQPPAERGLLVLAVDSTRSAARATTALGDPNADYGVLGEESNDTSYSFNFQWTASSKVFVEGFVGYYEQARHRLGVPDTDLHHVQRVELPHDNVPAEFKGPAGFDSGPNNLWRRCDDEDRVNLGLTATFNFNAGGTHTLKLGVQHAMPESYHRLRITPASASSVTWDSSFFGQRGTYGYYLTPRHLHGRRHQVQQHARCSSRTRGRPSSAGRSTSACASSARASTPLGELRESRSPRLDLGCSASATRSRRGWAWPGTCAATARGRSTPTGASSTTQLKHRSAARRLRRRRASSSYYYTLDTYDWTSLSSQPDRRA